MKQAFLLLLLMIGLCQQATATHIVGGEMELKHLEGFKYRLLLYLYFDEVNGTQGAKDPANHVTIFEKGTNKAVTTVSLPIQEQKQLSYTNINCTTGELRTSLVLYYQDLYLDPTIYSHPQGYYAVWERCCRNNTINNIVSPEAAGTVFYLEFPAVVKTGKAFVNSSAKLSPPPTDYACKGELFTYDFSSTDADGDKLVYDLVTPLNGYSSPDFPAPPAASGPYPEVSWQAGHSVTNQIRGTPPVKIDRNTGKLVVNPSYVGLFVFGVRCQEFRDGVKIGEVRRDFQLLVKDCPRNESPAVIAQAPGNTKNYQEGQTIRIGPSDSRCLDVFFTDRDPDEPLVLEAKPVNFDVNSFSFTGPTSGVANTGGIKDVLQTSICLDPCLNSEGKVYFLDLIVSDDGDQGCSLPRQDTLRLSFIVAPTPNAPPTLSLSSPTRVFEVAMGDIISFDVTGTDPDLDQVSVSAAGRGFDLSSQQVTFQENTATGQVTSPFKWQIDCKALQQPVYQVEFTVTAITCGKPVTTTETIEIRTKADKIAGNRIAQDQTVCYGATASAITGSTPSGGGNTYTYTWEVSTADTPGVYQAAPGDNSKPDYTPKGLTKTSWFRRKVTGACTEVSISNETKVTIVPLPPPPSAVSTNTCAGERATLTAAAATHGMRLEWYDGPTGGNLLHEGTTYETAPLSTTTRYYVQAVNSNGCASSSRVAVTAKVLAPTADAGEDITVIQGSSAGLHGQGGDTYLWSPATGLSDPHDARPLATPSQTTTYTLSVVTAYGCTYTDEITVTVLPRIDPTNTITLNGDDINDKWHIRNIEHYPNCRIQVFTRWGNKVYESTGYNEPWNGTYNGKPLPMAAYYYIIDLGMKAKPVSGSITLIK
ncbi:gliding motility-associated-like protein [Pontibacter ummariensis]|uniref:Gliding motility-associated C-terminal domain-containing protein n=1 Tax=Pontibacter ummariensis TaxID=1610492 RepID=A0A239K5T4_9BACT|nr:gliding motility-associated C-terminal domain-containing protein [Pontibacter ummariensis]PRY06742.1 gliding motility-associated-like protein [Pontibacter ummariensis]SNT13485.1 gliding motility-associated C-terminal domain-containing protein [Pontibacter ummariensis]